MKRESEDGQVCQQAGSPGLPLTRLGILVISFCFGNTYGLNSHSTQHGTAATKSTDQKHNPVILEYPEHVCLQNTTPNGWKKKGSPLSFRYVQGKETTKSLLHKNVQSLMFSTSILKAELLQSPVETQGNKFGTAPPCLRLESRAAELGKQKAGACWLQVTWLEGGSWNLGIRQRSKQRGGLPASTLKMRAQKNQKRGNCQAKSISFRRSIRCIQIKRIISSSGRQQREAKYRTAICWHQRHLRHEPTADMALGVPASGTVPENRAAPPGHDLPTAAILKCIEKLYLAWIGERDHNIVISKDAKICYEESRVHPPQPRMQYVPQEPTGISNRHASQVSSTSPTEATEPSQAHSGSTVLREISPSSAPSMAEDSHSLNSRHSQSKGIPQHITCPCQAERTLPTEQVKPQQFHLPAVQVFEIFQTMTANKREINKVLIFVVIHKSKDKLKPSQTLKKDQMYQIEKNMSVYRNQIYLQEKSCTYPHSPRVHQKVSLALQVVLEGH
ncbi:hypothetical protein Nmel_006665 [Mimus melanotis]